jgi:branched-chain amino acid transport system ATP-binding protein
MRLGSGFWTTLLHSPGFRHSEAEMDRRAREFLDILDLGDALDETAGNLPYGAQRRVEIARALATGPKLLLLDEPSAGMNPQETDELIEVIRLIHKEYDLTILLVEHDMSLVMSLCERLQVLNRGRVLAEGLPEEIRRNPGVIEAYLGSPKEKCDA